MVLLKALSWGFSICEVRIIIVSTHPQGCNEESIHYWMHRCAHPKVEAKEMTAVLMSRTGVGVYSQTGRVELGRWRGFPKITCQKGETKELNSDGLRLSPACFPLKLGGPTSPMTHFVTLRGACVCKGSWQLL